MTPTSQLVNSMFQSDRLNKNTILINLLIVFLATKTKAVIDNIEQELSLTEKVL